MLKHWRYLESRMPVSDGFGDNRCAAANTFLFEHLLRRPFVHLQQMVSGSVAMLPDGVDPATGCRRNVHIGKATLVAFYEHIIHVSQLEDNFGAAIPDEFRGAAFFGSRSPP